MFEAQLRRAAQPLTDAWARMPIEQRRSTLLGVSFRTPQVAAYGLDERAALQTLLTYPLQLIRLGAYWNRIEPTPGAFDTSQLDWQVESAERAGVPIILCIGPLKTLGYPEFFVPAHHLRQPLREHTLIYPSAYPALFTAATEYLARLVERYRDRRAIVAWQLEHEAVDPLGVEHSWRLAVDFVAGELDALRAADPSRPVVLNGYLPTSTLVRLSQWLQTRDQGDSLATAQRLADIVGVDYYPRHALTTLGAQTLYLDGGESRWLRRRANQLVAWAHESEKRLMITEGQAEPWESVTTPPNPTDQRMFSCPPEQVIANYNACMRWGQPDTPLYAYLFWGAEYWLLRAQSGDPSYLAAFARIMEQG